jgi:hypothetical protein
MENDLQASVELVFPNSLKLLKVEMTTRETSLQSKKGEGHIKVEANSPNYKVKPSL